MLEVNAEEGWAKRKHNRYSNKIEAQLPLKTSIDGHNSNIKLSERIWVFAHNGKWAKSQLDHKDGNNKNNKISNLREVTNSQNGMNQKLFATNKSGVTGVHWHNQCQKWVAEIRINGRDKYLGLFYDFEDARQARYDAEDQYFGEFARRHSRPRAPMKDLFST